MSERRLRTIVADTSALVSLAARRRNAIVGFRYREHRRELTTSVVRGGQHCPSRSHATAAATKYINLYVRCMYMSTKRVNFRLPEELVTQADIAAEVTHKNRTEILIEALRQYLEELGAENRFREAVVELYLDDQIDFEKLAEIIGRQDAEAVRSSKQVLDRGEELADDLADS